MKRQRSQKTLTYKKKRNSAPRTFTKPMKPEVKVLDVLDPDVDLFMNNCSLIELGGTSWQRVGSRVNCISLDCRFTVNYKPTLPGNFQPATFRFWLLYDRANNNSASVPSTSEVWNQENTGGGTKTYDFLAYRDVSSMKRYKVLAEKFVDMNYYASSAPSGDTGTYPSNTQKHVTLNAKFPTGLPVTFSGANAATAQFDLATGAFYFGYSTTNGDANDYSVKALSRLRYYDA